MVTTTADSGTGSLRDAINQINLDTTGQYVGSHGIDEIDFAITASSDTGGGYNAITGVCTISPASALPVIARPTFVDGYTQSGAGENTLPNGENAVLKIELNGASVPGTNEFTTIGLAIASSNSTVQGLAINSFGGSNIYVTGSYDHIQGNFIGTEATGTQTPFVPNLSQFAASDHVGIHVNGGSHNVIGTDGDGVNDPGERNVVAGNNYGITLRSTSNTVVAGNFIGTESSGTHALPN
jgi:titin